VHCTSSTPTQTPRTPFVVTALAVPLPSPDSHTAPGKAGHGGQHAIPPLSPIVRSSGFGHSSVQPTPAPSTPPYPFLHPSAHLLPAWITPSSTADRGAGPGETGEAPTRSVDILEDRCYHLLVHLPICCTSSVVEDRSMTATDTMVRTVGSTGQAQPRPKPGSRHARTISLLSSLRAETHLRRRFATLRPAAGSSWSDTYRRQ
jgi:hypothetical protein